MVAPSPAPAPVLSAARKLALLEDVPAIVLELAAEHRVHVAHPAGPHHPNYLATLKRYRKRGWTLAEGFPHWPAHVAPVSHPNTRTAA